MSFSCYMVVVLALTMMPPSSLSSASWLYDHSGGDEGRDGSCFPTQDSDNRSFTCRGENITAIPGDMPRNITQL